jgi:ribosomal-protein-alanine N-acetyltransferase
VIHVEPATAAHLECLLAGEDEFRTGYSLRIADGYVEFPGVIEHSLAAVRDGTNPRWSTYLIVHDVDAAVIGIGGFKGPPADGAVEISYAIAPVYRKQGHATRAARQFVEIARDAGVHTVRAQTLAEHNASTKVLERCGFEYVGEVIDPDDGPVWCWELRGSEDDDRFELGLS